MNRLVLCMRAELAAHWGSIDLPCLQDAERVEVLYMVALW